MKLKGLIITSEYPTLPKGNGNNAMRLVFSLKQDGKELNIIANQQSKNRNNNLSTDKENLFMVMQYSFLGSI